MERYPKTLLFEIARSCRKIKEFTCGLEVETYAGDELIRSAVERQFIVIGEALNRLKTVDENLFGSIDDARQMVGFRNVLVHGYDVVSDDIVLGNHIGKCTFALGSMRRIS